MRWKLPPKIKIYEALGALADQRIEMIDENEAKVYSSSRQKFYSIKYDQSTNSIMSNDSGSYWAGYLGYPSIAFLMFKKKIDYDEELALALKDIRWKDINVKFKNDFSKTEEFVLETLKIKGLKENGVKEEIDRIYAQVRELAIGMLGSKIKPPEGY